MPNIIKPSGVNQLWAAGGTKVDPGLSKINIGWVVELPPYQYQNWLDNRQDTFIAHINQHGIPEWDTETEYQGNLSYTQGSDGIIYKCIQTHTNLDPVNPLNSAYWARAFEVYGSVAVVQNALTAHLTNYATLSGISNPVAARNNLSVYSKTESDVRYAFKAGTNTQTFSVGPATLPEHAIRRDQVLALLVAATESVAGIIQIATTGEVSTGTNDTKAITPLKAATVYLSKAGNLAGLTNTATARSNLGLGTIATESAGSFLAVANNLSDVANAATARTNLGITSTATQAETYFLRTSLNLSDVPSPATARSNLGLGTAATFASTAFLQTANNLSDVPNKPVARSNLGLSTSATLGENTWLKVANNFSDVANTTTARANLGLTSTATTALASFLLKADNLAGLGNTATARANLGLGTAATFASTSFLQTANNLSDLNNAQTARNNLGLQSLATYNAVGVSAAGISGSYLNFDALVAANGYEQTPNGLVKQWGLSASTGPDSSVAVSFPVTFSAVFNIQITQIGGLDVLSRGAVGISNITGGGFQINNGADLSGPFYWYAIGVL